VALLIPSPAQGEAFRAWVRDALNTDDAGDPIAPEPFPDEAVIWGDRDHPRLGRYCLLQGLALTGPPVLLQYNAVDVGGPGQDLQEVRHRYREWTVLITVAARPDRTAAASSQLADAASEHLARVVGSTEGVRTVSMAAVGLGFLRLGDVVDDARLRGGTEYETRASVTMVWRSGWVARSSVEWLERVTGTGTVGDLDPLAFDSDQGAS